MAENGHFGHVGQSEVSENGTIGTTEAHSEYLGTSLFRFGLKIAILGGFMGIFGSFWGPVQPYQNICSPKWTPPSFLALKTTILSLSSTL